MQIAKHGAVMTLYAVLGRVADELLACLGGMSPPAVVMLVCANVFSYTSFQYNSFPLVYLSNVRP